MRKSEGEGGVVLVGDGGGEVVEAGEAEAGLRMSAKRCLSFSATRRCSSAKVTWREASLRQASWDPLRGGGGKSQ